MLRIGLTGGIGSGKSVVAERFAALGIPVIDADVLARELVAPGQPALSEILEAFGTEFLKADGTLDRAALRAHVFSHPTARTRLEAILHPAIRAEMLRRLQALSAPYCILVIPLLIETGQSNLVDRILLVDVDPSIQHQRIAHRDGLTESEIDAILAAQADRQARLDAADDVIDNSGEPGELDAQVGDLHARYLTLADARDPPAVDT